MGRFSKCSINVKIISFIFVYMEIPRFPVFDAVVSKLGNSLRHEDFRRRSRGTVAQRPERRFCQFWSNKFVRPIAVCEDFCYYVNDQTTSLNL